MTTVLRYLPGKRKVIITRWIDEDAVAKIFLDPKRHKLHAMRELQGYKLLTKAKLLTPKLLYAGPAEQGKQHAVIYQKIENAKVYSELEPKAQLDALFKIADIFQDMHQHQLIQTDPHLDNFLFTKDEVYIIDCAGIKKTDKHSCKENFALFLAQIPYPHHTEVLERFTEFKQLCHNFRLQRLRKYAKKVLRNCTQIITYRSFTSFIACDRQACDAELFNNLDKAIDQAQVLKAGNSSTVVKMSFKNKDYIIKRYNIKNLKHALSRCYRASRACRAWQHAHCLHLLGFATPKPIAMVERRLGPFRRQAYFIYEAIDGTPIDQSHRSQTHALLQALKSFGISHGDTKASNFLHADNRIYLIDLDAMRIHATPRTFDKAFERDIKRFERNWS